MSSERLDYYIYISNPKGCYGEYHIWASKEEAKALKTALKKTIPRGEVIVEPGGEYHWIVDDTTDLTALANEIATHAGLIQP